MLLCLTGAVFGEGEISPPETPAPARVHTPPQATPEPPPVLDGIRDPSAAASVRFRLDTKILHVWFPDIMNADEAVLLYDGEVWLLDCGDERNGSRGVELMQKLGIRKIDRIINSHPHHDHLNGLSVTNEAIPVEQLYICFPSDSTDSMVKALEYAESSAITVKTYRDGDILAMGDGKVTLTFWCNDDPSLDMNNNSAVTLLQYGTRRILFTADMERPGQAALLSRVSPLKLRADILKYPHHGKSGLTDEFLEAVSPSLAIITNASVRWGGVEYLAWRRIPYYFTNPGNKTYIHLCTDGNTWIVESVPYDAVSPLE